MLLPLLKQLDPQENVWSWVESELRRQEERSDSLEDFRKKLLKVARRYPHADMLIPSMAHRIQEVLKRKGGMTKY